MQAVITADIVNSTKLSPNEFKKLVTDIEQLYPAPNRIEFYRGDSFQAFIADGIYAYKIMLLSRLRSIAYSEGSRIDIRLSISLGNMDKDITHLGNHIEDIFINSGRTFDQFDKKGSRSLLINSGDKAHDLSYNLIARYTDSLLSQVSAKQASALYYLFSGKNQKEIAALLDKSEPTISQHIKKARFEELENLLESYETLTRTIDNGK